MPSLTDHLVALTNPRDRESLDLALTRALMDLLQPLSVALYGVVSDAINPRWLPLAVQKSGCAVQVCDSLRLDFRLLPLLQEFTRRQQCLETRLLVELEVEVEEYAGTWVSCLPLFSASWTEEAGVVEVYSKQRLTYKAQNIFARLLQVYRNMCSLFSVSERDALTGLLNRKSFDDTFYKLLADRPWPQELVIHRL